MKEKKTFLRTFVIIIIFLAVIFALDFYDEILKKLSIPKPNNTIPIIVSGSFVQRVGESVVLVKTEVGNGTGFFYSQEGRFVRILTCEHGIKNTKQAVIYYNDKTYLAIVVGTNSIDDIAALQITVPEDFHVPIVKFGNSKLQKDEFVVVCGYNRITYEEELCEKTIRLGLFQKMVPAFYKRTEAKTDTSICKGNSGAPLFNFKGKVVGMIYAGMFPEPPDTPMLINSTESLAVPIDAIKKFLSSLPNPSEVERIN